MDTGLSCKTSLILGSVAFFLIPSGGGICSQTATVGDFELVKRVLTRSHTPAPWKSELQLQHSVFYLAASTDIGFNSELSLDQGDYYLAHVGNSVSVAPIHFAYRLFYGYKVPPALDRQQARSSAGLSGLQLNKLENLLEAYDLIIQLPLSFNDGMFYFYASAGITGYTFLNPADKNSASKLLSDIRLKFYEESLPLAEQSSFARASTGLARWLLEWFDDANYDFRLGGYVATPSRSNTAFRVLAGINYHYALGFSEANDVNINLGIMTRHRLGTKYNRQLRFAFTIGATLQDNLINNTSVGSSEDQKQDANVLQYFKSFECDLAIILDFKDKIGFSLGVNYVYEYNLEDWTKQGSSINPYLSLALSF